eukprot:jgi/Tetstr1/457419/TSEL_004205.t1
MASLSLEDLDVGPLRGVIRAEQLPVSRAVGKGGRSRANLVADIKVARDRQGGMKRVMVEQAQPASTPLGRAARTPAALKFPEWRREETRKTPDGDMRIAKITMEKNNKACKLVLLAKMFPGRTLIVETAMPNDKEARDGKPKGIVPPVALDPKDKTNDMIGSGHDERDGELYHLVACKIKDGSGGFFGSKTKLIQWVYVKAPSVASLAAEMEALADFASLPRPRKLAARLELLACEEQANKYLLLPTAFFKVIDEPRTTTGAVAEDGCGFVPPELLADIARSVPGNKHVHQPLAIQVRVFAPTLGVFKGMLAVRRKGKHIQLTPSMRKVPPSAAPRGALAEQGFAVLLVKQVHPTRKNLLKGNHLRDHLNSTAVPVLHEKWRPDKPICKMIQRLFLHLGLPQNVIDDYSCGHETKRDAWLVGLADPTRAIPEGHVFVTGLPQLRQAFVTRSPTIKASDGRVFPTLAAQPSDMSTKQWRWLCGLPFGGIIFSARGPVPMPSQCAAGDLDGDYYFVLWDEAMVNGLAPGARQAAQDAADEVPATADLAAMPRAGLPTKGERASRKEDAAGVGAGGRCWLEEAQVHLTDMGVLRENLKMAKYFKLWEKEVELNGMASANAADLGLAYVWALDLPKHGGKDPLPGHLLHLVKGGKGKGKGKRQPRVEDAGDGAGWVLTSDEPPTVAELRAMGKMDLRRVVHRYGLQDIVSTATGGTGRRATRHVAEDVIAALKHRPQQMSQDEKELISEAGQLWRNVQQSGNAELVVECMGKRARYLGGHSTSRDQEGCNWLVLCVCKDCKDKPVEYTENGGRVMTMEEFFEHGTGPQGSVDCNAWRTVVYVHVIDANGKKKVLPMRAWLNERSHLLHKQLEGTDFLIYWPGEEKWFTTRISSCNKRTCALDYSNGDEEQRVCLAGELIRTIPGSYTPGRASHPSPCVAGATPVLGGSHAAGRVACREVPDDSMHGAQEEEEVGNDDDDEEEEEADPIDGGGDAELRCTPDDKYIHPAAKGVEEHLPEEGGGWKGGGLLTRRLGGGGGGGSSGRSTKSNSISKRPRSSSPHAAPSPGGSKRLCGKPAPPPLTELAGMELEERDIMWEDMAVVDASREQHGSQARHTGGASLEGVSVISSSGASPRRPQLPFPLLSDPAPTAPLHSSPPPVTPTSEQCPAKASGGPNPMISIIEVLVAEGHMSVRDKSSFLFYFWSLPDAKKAEMSSMILSLAEQDGQEGMKQSAHFVKRCLASTSSIG